MACYCGTCATRISSAFDNNGSFKVTKDFRGWSERVADTCDGCAARLAEAVTRVANAIAEENRAKVDQLRVDVEKDLAAQKAYELERKAFETAWNERKRNLR